MPQADVSPPVRTIDHMELLAEATVALSPSRVGEFKTCPQLYKFRFIDKLPEPLDPYAARGSLVHTVLESLFSLSPSERTIERARQALDDAWAALKEAEEMAGWPLSVEEEAAWLVNAHELLGNYFRIEDPTTIEPEQIEWWVEHQADKLLLRGIIDRVEVDDDGEWILSDYKTGRSPSDLYALGSFFGLKFYALVCWRAFGKMPKALRLIHLREPETITLVPTPQMLEGLERQLEAVGRAILSAYERDDWRPRPNRWCNTCAHQPICPAFPTEPG